VSELGRLDALEDIVRELAECGPFIDEDTGCVMCTQEWYLIRDNPSRWAMIDEHEPSCLWRRAKDARVSGRTGYC
jgi:hypothetical protein